MATAGARRTRALVSLAAIILLGVAGCSSSDQGSGATSTSDDSAGYSRDSGTGSGKAAPPAQAGQDEAAPEDATQEGAGNQAGGPGARTGTEYAAAQRQIIYTGTMTIRVDDVGLTASRLIQRTQAAGGFVGADRRSGDREHETAELSLRIPADKFTPFVDEAGKTGTVVNRDVSADDVSKQIQDLDARLLAARASVERVRALLARAQSISDITAIEAELAKREGDLESLQARKNSLADQVSFSTLTIRLVAKGVPVAQEKGTGFLAGLTSGWRAFTGFMRGLLTVLGAVLPFLALIVVVGAPVWWLVRRRRTGPVRAVAAPAAAGGAPVPAAGTTMREPAPAGPGTAPPAGPDTAPPAGPGGAA